MANTKFPGLDQKYVAEIEKRTANIPAQYKAQAQQIMYSDYYQKQKREQDQAKRAEEKALITQKIVANPDKEGQTVQNANIKLSNLADMIRDKWHLDLSAGDDTNVVNKFVDQLSDGNKLLIDYLNGKNSKLLTKSGLVKDKTFNYFVNLNDKINNKTNNGQVIQKENRQPTTLTSTSLFDDDDYASNFLARQGSEYDDFIEGARSKGYMDGEIASVINAQQTYNKIQEEYAKKKEEYASRGVFTAIAQNELKRNIQPTQGLVNRGVDIWNNLFANDPNIGLTFGKNIDKESVHFSDDIMGIGNNYGDLLDQDLISRGYRFTGKLAGDILLTKMLPGGGGGEFGTKATLDAAKNAGWKGILKELGQRMTYGAAEGAEIGAVSSLSEEDPTLEKTAENVAGGAILGGVFGAGGEARDLAKLAKEGNLSKILKEFGEKDVLNKLKDQFYKSVKPSSRGVDTLTKSDQYYDDAVDSVELIIKNKDSLKFVDANGEETVGQLPKNLDEFAQAIKQVKEKIYPMYTKMVQQAGKASVVDTKKIVNELKKLRNNEEWMAGKSESTKNEMDKWIRDLEALDNKLSVEGAQQKTQELNEELQAFIKSKNPNDVGPNWIKSKVNGWIKDGINDAIENAGLDSIEYQNLKKAYSSLRTIESDVNHRAIVYGRQNPESLVDSLSNLESIDALAQFIKDPKGGTLKFIGSQLEKYGAKSRNNPNNIINKMFGDAEKTIQSKSTLKTTAQQEAQASANAAARNKINIKNARQERLEQRKWLTEQLNKIKAQQEADYQAYQEWLQGKGVGSETPALPGKQTEYSSIIHDNRPIAVDPNGNVIKGYNEVQEIPAKVKTTPSEANPIVNEKTGETLNDAIEKLRAQGWEEETINNFKEAVLKKAKGEEYKLGKKTLDELIEPVDTKVTEVYHGTRSDVADNILKEGYKPSSELPEGAYKGGGYDATQDVISFSTNKGNADVFANVSRDGTVLKSEIKDGANVVKMKGIEKAEELSEYLPELREKGIDAVILDNGENEFIVINKDIIGKSSKA